MVQSLVRPRSSELLPVQPAACTVLTPNGTIIAKGQALPRDANHLPEAYALRLVDVEPRGVLEAMVYADRPHVVLRLPGVPELPVRIDHITGTLGQRVFFCHTR